MKYVNQTDTNHQITSSYLQCLWNLIVHLVRDSMQALDQ